MTVIIGYTAENFSILATDTRLFKNGRKEDGILNDYVKLRDLPYPLGWCCGAGFNYVLNNFVELLPECISKIGSDDFNVVIKNMFDRTKEDYPDFIETIERSNLITTWFTRNELTQKLQSVASFLNYKGIVGIQKNTFFISYPYDYTNDMVLELANKYETSKEHILDLDAALQKIFNIFNEISLNSDGVSRICDVGIQNDISNELIKSHIKDDIENLIK